MRFFRGIQTLAVLIIWLMSTCTASAQDGPATLSIDYGVTYELDKGFSILFDNTLEDAKIKDFSVKFSTKAGVEITQTDPNQHPINGNIVSYDLKAPVKGFQIVELTITSLHSGRFSDLPSDISEIFALIEPSEIPPNTILAKNKTFQVEAVQQEVSLEFSDLYSATDGSAVTVTTRTVNAENLSYSVQANGIVVLKSPRETGQYEISYEAKGTDDTSAAGTITVDITLPTNLMTQLNDAQAAIALTLDNVETSKAKIENRPHVPNDLITRLNELLATNETLMESACNPVKLEKIQALKAELETAKTALSITDLSDGIAAAELQALAIKEQLTNLQIFSATSSINVDDLATDVKNLTAKLPALNDQILKLTPSRALSLSDIENWEAMQKSFSTSLLKLILFIAGIIGLVGLGIIIFKTTHIFSGKPSATSSSQIRRPNSGGFKHPEAAGVIFTNSPLLGANVAAPLSAAGQLTASQLQMLTGPYYVLRPAYQATGRIGYAQEGIPSAEDYSFGTGFLITDRHVVTNRHVHGLYGHYLTGEDDIGGIEFIAEKDKDSSDFIPFDGSAPRLLPGLDIAIFTLEKPVKNRNPIPYKPIDTDELEGREIVVIGYPDTHTPNDAEILSVVEDDPVFAVKRISQGRIFRHSTDTDTPFGVQTDVSENKNTHFEMTAICHNASTMGGNSGSPLLDIHTGDLLGIHFAGFKVFNQKEAANLAMAIAQLTAEDSLKDLTA